jgi:hypothetical protein
MIPRKHSENRTQMSNGYSTTNENEYGWREQWGRGPAVAPTHPLQIDEQTIPVPRHACSRFSRLLEAHPPTPTHTHGDARHTHPLWSHPVAWLTLEQRQQSGRGLARPDGQQSVDNTNRG